jgi:hypothetical protein
MRHALTLIVPCILSLSSVSFAQDGQPSSGAAPAAEAAAPTQPAAAPPATPTPSPAPASAAVASTQPPSAATSTPPSPEPAQPTTTEAPASAEPCDCSCRAKRSGFYLRFGSGPSVVGVTGTGPHGKVSTRGGGDTSTIAIGGSVSRGLVLAGTVHASVITSTLDGGPFEGATVTVGGETKDASEKVAATFSHLGLLVD